MFRSLAAQLEFYWTVYFKPRSSRRWIQTSNFVGLDSCIRREKEIHLRWRRTWRTCVFLYQRFYICILIQLLLSGDCSRASMGERSNQLPRSSLTRGPRRDLSTFDIYVEAMAKVAIPIRQRKPRLALTHGRQLSMGVGDWTILKRSGDLDNAHIHVYWWISRLSRLESKLKGPSLIYHSDPFQSTSQGKTPIMFVYLSWWTRA